MENKAEVNYNVNNTDTSMIKKEHQQKKQGTKNTTPCSILIRTHGTVHWYSNCKWLVTAPSCPLR